MICRISKRLYFATDSGFAAVVIMEYVMKNMYSVYYN